MLKLILIFFILIVTIFFVNDTLNDELKISQPENQKLIKNFNKRLISDYFVEKVISDYKLIYPKIKNIDDLKFHNKKIFVNLKDYQNSYNNIQIRDVHQVETGKTLPIIKLDYVLNGKEYNAFAYGSKLKNCGDNQIRSSLIIPGTGNNQSTAIYLNKKNNYHYGIIDSLKNVNNILVLIKPNRDALSWHNGKNKRVTNSLVYNWQISMGGSYSVSYLVQAMAFIKYIKSCKHKSIIAGLSQGGTAALHVALQSNPSLAIIASGFSLLEEKVKIADFNQLVAIPGSEKLYSPDTFIELIKNSPVKYFFCWGSEENDYYGLDAKILYTSKFLKKTDNAIGISHSGGHRFPVFETQQFIENN